MKINYMGRTIQCERCTETGGKLTIYKDGEPSIEIANIPDLGMVNAEDGVIEHILTPLEKAWEDINDLQADLAAKTEEAAQWYREYVDTLADDEAKRARLERISTLVQSIGETPSLTGLLTFLRSLKEILSEVQ